MKKTLKGLFCLDHNIKLFIPSTVQVDHIDKDLQDKQITLALELFSICFGGATSYEAIGAWNSQTAGLVTESVTIIESYATKEAIEQYLTKVIEHAEALKLAMSQEAISLEYDNKLYFI
jgi:hypothetical protein